MTLPDRHELVIEPREPVESLIDERFEANHADLVQGTLLALVGADLAQHEEAGARACLVEAETFRDKLSTRTRAGLAMTRLAVEDVTDGAAALKQAERAAQADAGHVDLWNQLVALTYVGLSTGETTRDDLLRRAIAASAADPNDALAPR